MEDCNQLATKVMRKRSNRLYMAVFIRRLVSPFISAVKLPLKANS